MSEEYTFDQGAFNMSRVLITDGTTVWQEEEEVPAEHYQDLSDTMNESYATAENGTSQFFSVLESSSETILNDMSHMIEGSRDGDGFVVHTDECGAESVEEGQEVNQEIMLFHVEGSDTMYGEQFAQDEEGNLQKFRFQVRQNENGDFETIPETLQLVPFQTDEELCLPEGESERIEKDSDGLSQDRQTIIKQEVSEEPSVSQTNPEDRDYIEREIPEMDETEEEENLMETEPQSSQIFLKQEYVEEETTTETPVELKKEAEELSNAYQELYFGENEDLMECPEEVPHEQMVNLKVTQTEEPMQTPEILSHTDLFCYAEESQSEENQVEVEEEELGDNNNQDYLEEGTEEIRVEMQSDNMHIFIEDDRGMLLKRKMLELRSKSPVNKTALKNINRNVRDENKSPSMSIIEDVEKENVKNFIITGVKPHPRSLLKTSCGKQVTEEKVEFEKRFAKGKFAAQARQLQNFISQTKILEVPERTERLPRKQKISPLVRSGEEVVIQEVVVSSDGFVNTLEDGVLRERKMLETTDYIHLSDSEDESTKKKKKKRQQKNQDPPIVISDSDSEESVIEVKKLPHQCSKCEKSFPSAGGLNTHMQYHNFSEVKYACSECNQTFKNNALLNRHVQTHTENNLKFNCKLCNKSFKSKLDLMTHKRTHVKNSMFIKTTTEISPKKRSASTLPVMKKSTTEHKYKCEKCNQSFINNILLNRHAASHKTSVQPSTSKTSTTNTTGGSLKCKDCGKTFSTQLLLTSHLKTHKSFKCKNCPLSFTSNILLQNHVLKNCVKSPVRKIDPLRMQLKCDTCNSVFANHTLLLEHLVLVHKVETPDKSIGRRPQRKSLYKPAPAHSGIPLPKKMNAAFNKLREKLNEL